MSSWVKALVVNRKVPGSKPLGARQGLRTQPRCEAHVDLWVKHDKERSDDHRVSEAIIPLIML